MPERVIDETGLPAPGSKNPRGTLTISPNADDWSKLIALKSRWEAQRQTVYSVTDIIRATIHQAYQRLADSGEQLPGALDAPPAPSSSSCPVCVGMPAGDVFQCIECERPLGRDIDTEGAFVNGLLLERRPDGKVRAYGKNARKPDKKKPAKKGR